MANLNSLPTEILRDILHLLNDSITELRNYSLVCKKLSGLANAELYKSIDLNHQSDDPKAVAKTERRQERFLRSIAENPKLGALVGTLKTAKVPIYRWKGDVDLKLESSVYIAAAKNMILLTKASLTPSPISAHMLVNLGSYPQLEHLNIEGLKPEDYVWSPDTPTALASLKWIIPSNWEDEGPAFESASFLLKVVEKTCRNLQSLDVVLNKNHSYDTPPSLPKGDPSRAEFYNSLDMDERAPLKDLRHFGFRYQNENGLEEWESLLGVFERYKGTLKSVSIPVNSSYDRRTLDFLFKVVDLLPGLKSFTIMGSQGGSYPGTETEMMTGYKFFDALTAGFVERGVELEKFEVWDMRTSFRERMGLLFARWKCLKSLRLGDEDNNGGEFASDGRLDFFEYRAHILKFVKRLPLTLEQLTLEINGPNLFCDEDGDFDPIASLGPEIFTSLRRLHSFDIHAWITNCDGGLGAIPEKAVFCRRLPFTPQDTPSSESKNQPHDPRTRDLCISRMDCIYQASSVFATKLFHSLKLDSGEKFEGRDAGEAWCGGLTTKKPGATGRGRPKDWPDHSWPFFEDKAVSYEGFRKRY